MELVARVEIRNRLVRREDGGSPEKKKKKRRHIFVQMFCPRDGNTEGCFFFVFCFYIVRKSLIVWKVEKAKVLLLHGETMQPHNPFGLLK